MNALNEGRQHMRREIFMMVLLLAFAVIARPASAAESAKLDTAKIEELTGAKGKLDEKEGAFKVSVPRSDLSVTAAGARLTPPMEQRPRQQYSARVRGTLRAGS